MIKQYAVPVESSQEWKDALKGVPHAFGHTWEHCYAMYLTTRHPTYLYCYEEDDARIVCPIAEREYVGHTDILKPFGFSGFVGNADPARFRDHWSDFVRERGYVCGYLGLNPLFDLSSHFNPGDVHQYDTVHVLDLTMSLDALFSNLDRNRRRQLRHWDIVGKSLVFDRSELSDFFIGNYTEFIRQKNASSFYYFSDESLSFLTGLENVVLAGARESGRVVSVGLFAYTADAADALFYVTLPEGKKYYAALMWYGVTHLKSLGIPVLNLGGGGEFGTTYKARFGCRPLPLKCLKQVYDRTVYDSLCRRVNADPEDMSGYFPGYRYGER